VNPSLYDLLNVDETATTEEIRAAWKAAIGDLGPTDRRFRAFNQAAETLLDPERRRAYDAELAGAEEPEVAEPEPEQEAEPEPEPEAGAEPPPPTGKPVAWEAAFTRTVPRRLLIGAAVLALAAIVGTVWIWTRPGASGDVDRYEKREQAAQKAEAAAQEAVGPVLSFDYRGGLEDDAENASPYLTDEYASERSSLMEELAPSAREGEVVVTAEPIATGITRSGEDRAEILVYVDQRTERKDVEEPFTLKQWVRADMVHEDGRWLVDDLRIEAQGAG
jgi:Mce-associated membrane protein